MFVVELTYKKALGDVERALDSHVKYLEKYYEQGKFICSGRKNPRTGGMIICNACTITELESIIAEDPFYIEGIADYKIIEFEPTKYQEGFERYLE